jgi:serine/threonine-protein kinase RsbW
MNQAVQRPESGKGNLVELRIPCKAEWAAVARLAVSAVASRLRFTIEEIEDVKLAVAEAITNAIQNSRGAQQIEIVCESEPEVLRMHVRNVGARSRPEKIEPPRLDELPIDGLGIFLIRSLMDEVEYDVHPESGTDLVMVKRLRP